MSKKTQHDKPAESKWKKFAEKQEAEAEEHSEVEETPAGIELETDLGLEYPDRHKLEDQLTAMEQKVSEYKEKQLRAMAQLKNAQDRAERDVSNAHKFGTEKLITDLLPVVDSLMRGLENTPVESTAAREGLQLTLDLLNKTLNKHGAEILDPAEGDVFNPEWHEAMSMQKVPGVKANTIVKVLQPGYALNGRVLRAAMVIVAS